MASSPPASPADDALDLVPREGEHRASLTRDFFVLQRKKGHRYSVDDMLVAWLACTRAPHGRRVLDLGCGLGSVLLMTAWALPDAELVGIEAQEQSIELARRNVALNRCGQRVSLVHGDLREAGLREQLGRFDLITGTPPYFDPKAATPCSDPQRAHAKFELRGGIEAYCEAAASLLSPEGRFVVCGPSVPPGRTAAAMRNAGLHALSVRSVLPGSGRPAFLELVVAGLEPTEAVIEPELVLREADGRRNAEHAAIREWFGVPASVY